MSERAFRPPKLGPGAVYIDAFHEAFARRGDLIRVAEVEPSAHWVKGARDSRPRGSATKLAELAALPQAVVLHGVGYPVGGTLCDQDVHVGEFGRWAEALAAPWVSEHLSVFDAAADGGVRCLGFLMPPVQTEAGVRLAAANIARRRDRLRLPFAFETGVSYLPSKSWEMADGDFFAAVAAEADCGILLDLNNLWCNEQNGRGRIADVLAALPLDRVWEVHMARAEPLDGFWLDAHSGAIHPRLAALAADVVADLPNLGAIVFEVSGDRLPAFTEADLLAQAETLNRLWSVAGSGRSASAARPGVRRPDPPDAPSPAVWEQGLAHGLANPPAADPRDAAAFALYRRLVLAFRKGAVSDLLASSISLMLRELDEAAFAALFAAHAESSPPALYPNEEALAFAAFVRDRADFLPGLSDLLAFESGLIAAAADGETIRVDLAHDIEALLDALAARVPLADLPMSPCALEIVAEPRPAIRRLAI